MYYCCFWGWEKRQTKSRNKQRDKDNKIYLSWAQQILRNKSWEEQILNRYLGWGHHKIFKKSMGNKMWK